MVAASKPCSAMTRSAATHFTVHYDRADCASAEGNDAESGEHKAGTAKPAGATSS